MIKSIDIDPRRPSDRRLFVIGVCCMLVAAAIVTAALAKSKGKLNDLVRVSASLVDVGDGLPARSDVKFRGVLVGSVSDVVAAKVGQPNIVHIDLKPRYVSQIPNSVTARVVPSNVFAVSSVQFIDTGKVSAPLQAGAVVPEDKSLPTLIFQSALNRARELFRIVGRSPTDSSVGALTALGEATEGRGQSLTDAGHDLNEAVRQLDPLVGGDLKDSTLSRLVAAVDGLRTVAPELVDALGGAVKPMRTFAEKQAALTSMLSAGHSTAQTLADGLDHQTDRMLNVTTELAPVLGVLADQSKNFHTMFIKTQRVANNFYDLGWNPVTNTLLVKAAVSFTPFRSYIRADCPRYGEMAGPSCQTAPEVPTAPELLPALRARGLPAPPGITENRPNFAPPRGSIRGAPTPPPDAPPPSDAPLPAEAPPAPPLGAGLSAAPTLPPTPPGQSGPVNHQSAFIGGNVGPVGSQEEKEQLSRIVGTPPDATTDLLLGPLARGTTVHIAPDSEARP